MAFNIYLTQASLKEYAGSLGRLRAEVPELKKNLDEAKAALQKATAVRDKERKAYHIDKKNLLAVIQNCKHALVILKKNSADSNFMELGNAVLASFKLLKSSPRFGAQKDGQRKRSFLSAETLKNVSNVIPDLGKKSFLQTSGVGEVQGILQQMMVEAENDLKELEEEEKSARKNFEGFTKDKEEEIGVTEKQFAVKEKEHAAVKENQSVAFIDLSDSKKSLESDQELLISSQNLAKEQTAEFEMLLKSQHEELKAIQDAIGVLDSDEMLKIRQKKQEEKQKALLQEKQRQLDMRKAEMIRNSLLASEGMRGAEKQAAPVTSALLMEDDSTDSYIQSVLSGDEEKNQNAKQSAGKSSNIHSTSVQRASAQLASSGRKISTEKVQRKRPECNNWLDIYDTTTKTFKKVCDNDDDNGEPNETISFLQVHGEAKSFKSRRLAAATVRLHAIKTHSSVIDLVQGQLSDLSADSSAFGKVIKAIQNVIEEVKLEEKKEKEKKAECATDLEINTGEIEKVSNLITQLTGEIDQLDAEVEAVTEEKKGVQKEKAKIEAEMADAETLRQSEKDAFIAEQADSVY